MIQTVTTLGSLLLAAGASGIILQSLLEDKQALRAALLRQALPGRMTLPPRTHRIAGPRAARFIQLEAIGAARAAA